MFRAAKSAGQSLQIGIQIRKGKALSLLEDGD